jgi:hypothetical protein
MGAYIGDAFSFVAFLRDANEGRISIYLHEERPCSSKDAVKKLPGFRATLACPDPRDLLLMHLDI